MTIGVHVVTTNDRPEILFHTLESAVQLDGGYVLVDNTGRTLSRGVNAGLSYTQNTDILVHLDDDALIVDPDQWRDVLNALFLCNPSVGLVLPNGANYQEFIPGDHYGWRSVRWGLGFAWAMRRSLWEEIGGYDEQLLHQNECDLALRVRMAGYKVAASEDLKAIHNDPGGPRSDLALAREHLGCVQFRDKWTSYFRGRDWNYGTMPLYLMQHWPPDQEWYRRYAEQWGVELNPPPADGVSLPPGSVLGIPSGAAGPRIVTINGLNYLVYCDLRNDYGYWASGDGYLLDRQKAIYRWHELTGEKYTGYRWPRAVTSGLGEER